MNLYLKIFTVAVGSMLGFINVMAEAPASYYQSCEGKADKALLSALCGVIGSHTTVSYDGLWNVYKTSDVRDNGTVWDMYSTKQWRVGAEHCGNYTYVGDCINREHSMPKSWFSNASPMVSDAFHIYPTDGKVNGQRSNYPFGECSGGTTLPSNGNVKALGRLGRSTFSGYSGTVFEPDDEYKGDFARSYFYMAACYNDRISSWNSDMLAKNNYPVFTSWAVNLLMKWHRQDPVSEKEIKRNEAVYKHQRNRNPFIDHPELAEYIWGNKKGSAWSANGAADPEFTAPIDGTSINMGVAGVNVTRYASIVVKGTGLTQNVTATVSGAGFSVSPASLSASAVNGSGATVTVSYVNSAATTATGKLTLKSGTATSTVTISVRTLDGLPAGEATDITENSFVAHWTNVDNAGVKYQLAVEQNGELLQEYPVMVNAADEKYTVTGLEPETTYTYTVSSATLTSNTVTVTTAMPMPSIQFLFDGDLEFVTKPGEPSDVAELLLDIENISSDITISVTAPFQVSTDKADWKQSVTLTPGEDRFYLRLSGPNEGTYTTTLFAKAGSYENDDVTVSGVISSGKPSFIETFEPTGTGSYSDHDYEGSATTWKFHNTGIWGSDPAHGGDQAARFGKDATSSITTASAKTGGIGTVKFWARPFGNDGDATVEVQYSANGSGWATAGTVTVTGSAYAEYTVPVNVKGSQYLRLQQTAGKRFMIDDLSVSDYSGISAVQELEYHSWDAYCRAGELVIENGDAANNFTVYGIDGLTYYSECPGTGTFSVNLPAGLYIVVANDFSRRVVVK